MATHEFDRRLQQCLDALPGISAGRRQRLSRPLRQTDSRIATDVDAVGLGDALKAAIRTLLHETVDGVLLRLEAALDACSDAHAQALLAALAVQAAASGLGVRFRVADSIVDCGLSSAATCTIEPLPSRQSPARLAVVLADGAELARLVVRCDADVVRDAEACGNNMVFAIAEIEDDPFRCAAIVVERLRQAAAAADRA